MPIPSRKSLAIAAAIGFGALLLALKGEIIATAHAQVIKSVQEPITGNEQLEDLGQPEQALIQFYKDARFKHDR
jgi:hypothetical protein